MTHAHAHTHASTSTRIQTINRTTPGRGRRAVCRQPLRRPPPAQRGAARGAPQQDQGQGGGRDTQGARRRGVWGRRGLGLRVVCVVHSTCRPTPDAARGKLRGFRGQRPQGVCLHVCSHSPDVKPPTRAATPKHSKTRKTQVEEVTFINALNTKERKAVLQQRLEDGARASRGEGEGALVTLARAHAFAHAHARLPRTQSLLSLLAQTFASPRTCTTPPRRAAARGAARRADGAPAGGVRQRARGAGAQARDGAGAHGAAGGQAAAQAGAAGGGSAGARAAAAGCFGCMLVSLLSSAARATQRASFSHL